MAQYQLEFFGETFLFGLHLYLAGKMLRKSPKYQTPPEQCKCGPSNNMVSRGNHLRVPFLNKSPPPLRQFLRDKLLLKKN